MAIRPVGGSHLHHIGRESFLAPLKWENGWPVVGNNGTIDLEMDGPLPGHVPTPVSHDFDDHFTGKKLDLRWNFVRNPRRENYVLENGKITLISGDDISKENGNPTAILARQQAFNIEAEAVIEGEIVNGQKSGISAFYNSFHHYDIFVTKEASEHYVCLRKRVCDIDVVVEKRRIEYTGKISLKITSDPEWYTFLYYENGEYKELGKGKTALLSTEATSPMTFTGTYLGAFTENGKISVSRFKVKELK